ncbi:MAG: hypothetical protein ACRDBX_05350 [Erysipelotrichaceae bacterium]
MKMKLLIACALVIFPTCTTVAFAHNYVEDPTQTRINIEPKTEIEAMQEALDIVEQNTQIGISGSFITDTRYIGYTITTTGYKEVSGQPTNGYVFPQGGMVFYRDNNGYSIPLTVSIGGKPFGISAVIGTITVDPGSALIGINFAPSTTPKKAYIKKSIKVRRYDVYQCSPITPSNCTYDYSFSTQENLSIVGTSSL